MIQIEPAVLSGIDCCSGCGIDGFKTGETANGWIVILWLTGFSTEVRSRGAIGFHTFLFGAHLPILIHFWLFCFRMIGAEDIKSSSFHGGFSGSAAILKYVCRSFVFGETLSLNILLICGNIRQRLFKFTIYIKHIFRSHSVCGFVLVRREVLLICTKKKNIFAVFPTETEYMCNFMEYLTQ